MQHSCEQDPQMTDDEKRERRVDATPKPHIRHTHTCEKLNTPSTRDMSSSCCIKSGIDSSSARDHSVSRALMAAAVSGDEDDGDDDDDEADAD